MVGGYVLVAVPAVLGNPSFESGTKVPGIYETVSVAFSTGKILVCQFDGPIYEGTSVTPFASSIVKMPDGSLLLSVNGNNYSVKSDDTVVSE